MGSLGKWVGSGEREWWVVGGGWWVVGSLRPSTTHHSPPTTPHLLHCVFTFIPSCGTSTPPLSNCSPPSRPERTSRNPPLTGPVTTGRRMSFPSRTIQTTLAPPSDFTAA